jgi:hypothetical protein
MRLKLFMVLTLNSGSVMFCGIYDNKFDAEIRMDSLVQENFTNAWIENVYVNGPDYTPLG